MTASLTHRCVVPRRHHRGIGWVTRPRHPGAVLHCGLDLSLVNTLLHSSATIGQLDLALRGQALRHGDGRLDGLRPYPAGLPHQGDLCRRLEHPHVMNVGPEGCGK